jgi:hypothetical protein
MRHGHRPCLTNVRLLFRHPAGARVVTREEGRDGNRRPLTEATIELEGSESVDPVGSVPAISRHLLQFSSSSWNWSRLGPRNPIAYLPGKAAAQRGAL